MDREKLEELRNDDGYQDKKEEVVEALDELIVKLQGQFENESVEEIMEKLEVSFKEIDAVFHGIAQDILFQLRARDRRNMNL